MKLKIIINSRARKNGGGATGRCSLKNIDSTLQHGTSKIRGTAHA